MFKALKKYGAGSRRTARVRPLRWKVNDEKNGLLLSFQLPKGAYATAVLRELLKPQESIEDNSAVDSDVLDT
jgi:tRNA(Glu) U13 pseudouridine synthase TruD